MTHRGGWTLLAFFAVTVAVMAAVASMPVSEAPSVDQDLVDDYGYADVIVYEGTRSSVYIATKVPVQGSDGGVSYEWEVESVSHWCRPTSSTGCPRST